MRRNGGNKVVIKIVEIQFDVNVVKVLQIVNFFLQVLSVLLQVKNNMTSRVTIVVLLFCLSVAFSLPAGRRLVDKEIFHDEGHVPAPPVGRRSVDTEMFHDEGDVPGLPNGRRSVDKERFHDEVDVLIPPMGRRSVDTEMSHGGVGRPRPPPSGR